MKSLNLIFGSALSLLCEYQSILYVYIKISHRFLSLGMSEQDSDLSNM
jgi:hypothetical protein